MKTPDFKLSVWAALLPALLFAVPTWAAKSRVAIADTTSASSPAPERQQSSRPSLPYNDTRLAVFEFDPNLTYEVKTLDSLYTHIEIAPGDKIRGFYPSDTTRWKYHVAGNKERLFIKPTAPGLFNSVTMVTDRRVYELTFVSGKEGESWYKRVTWHYADERASSLASDGMGGVSGMDGVFEDIPAAALPAGRAGFLPVNVETDDDDSAKVDPASLRFNYTIEGEAAFRPVTVFDNGKFTWIRFKSNLQDIPAVFAIDASGKAEVIDYVPSKDNREIIITKVLPGILLKLRSDEVKISGTGGGGIAKKFCMFGC